MCYIRDLINNNFFQVSHTDYKKNNKQDYSTEIISAWKNMFRKTFVFKIV